jgi:hypothetical protein
MESSQITEDSETTEEELEQEDVGTWTPPTSLAYEEKSRLITKLMKERRRSTLKQHEKEYEFEFNMELPRIWKNVLNLYHDFVKCSTWMQGEVETPIIKISDRILSLPVSKLEFDGLTQFVSRSPFGLGTETVYNEDIRRGFEIDKSHVSIFRFPDLNDILDSIRVHMLGEKFTISCEFYKLLIYGEGGHFTRHRDTQTSVDHFGTLLIFLPSQYEGGNFLLDIGEEMCSFHYSIEENQTLRSHWLAFYTDMEHEISPVASGIRTVLSYKLYRKALTERNEEPCSKRFKVTYFIEKPPTSTECIHQLFSLFPNLKFVLATCHHNYTTSTESVRYLKGFDFQVYQAVRDQFHVSLEQCTFSRGFNDTSRYFTYTLCMNGITHKFVHNDEYDPAFWGIEERWWCYDYKQNKSALPLALEHYSGDLSRTDGMIRHMISTPGFPIFHEMD